MNNPITVLKPSIHLVGLKVRTSNTLESNAETAMIGKTIQKYYSLANQN